MSRPRPTARARAVPRARARSPPSPLELRQLGPRESERGLVLDRTLEHLDRLGLVALLGADLAQAIEDLALRDPDVRLETLEEQRAERLLRAIEVVRLEGEDPEILQDA